MASNPQIQKRAQGALDTIVGPDRLPTFEDQASLPYITAIAKECLRWRSVVPLSVPHVTTQEDEYKGYRIPKGSIVISNVWYASPFVVLAPRFGHSLTGLHTRAYSRDPAHYDDSETFDPERFMSGEGLRSDILDPSNFAFGYGRRYVD